MARHLKSSERWPVANVFWFLAALLGHRVGLDNLLGDKDNKSFKEIAPLVKKVSADMQLWRPSKN